MIGTETGKSCDLIFIPCHSKAISTYNRYDISQTFDRTYSKPIFQVHAKHEEQRDGKTVFREYNREFLVPAGTDPETIRDQNSKTFLTLLMPSLLNQCDQMLE